MVTKDSVLLSGVLSLLLAAGASAGEPVELILSQASVRPPEIKVYCDVLDSTGKPAQGIEARQLSGTIGKDQAEVIEVKSFADSGEGVAYILLIDISLSLRRQQFSQMREALEILVSNMKQHDRAAIITFGEECTLVADFTPSKDDLKAKLESLGPKDNRTQLHAGLVRALGMSQRKDEGLPDRRVIVVLTDGKDEGSGLAVDDVLAKIRQVHMPIYAIGYSGLPGGEREHYLEVLHRLARTSGGVYRDAGSASLQDIYADLEQAIRRVYVAKLTCPACPADGQAYSLQINLAVGGRALADSMEVAMVPGQAAPSPSPSPAPQHKPWWKLRWWEYAATGLAVLGIAVAAVAATRRKRPTFEEPPDDIRIPVHQHAPVRVELPMRLTVMRGPEAGAAYDLRLVDNAIIGRKANSDLVLAGDPDVSGEHCELKLIEGRVVITDLQSTNGTLVNGVPLSGRCRLESGDTIAIGHNELRVSFEEK
jgi:VWFA-related protein